MQYRNQATKQTGSSLESSVFVSESNQFKKKRKNHVDSKSSPLPMWVRSMLSQIQMAQLSSFYTHAEYLKHILIISKYTCSFARITTAFVQRNSEINEIYMNILTEKPTAAVYHGYCPNLNW